MNKRKKKVNSLEQQKISLAQQRNEFIILLKRFCDKVTDSEEIFKFIPSHDIDRLYKIRWRPVRVKVAPKHKVPSYVLKYCQDQLRQELKETELDFGVGSLAKITLHDYFSLAFTLTTYGTLLKISDYPAAGTVKKSLAPLVAKMETKINDEAWDTLSFLINCLAVLFCDFDTGMCAAKYETRTEWGDVGFCMEIYALDTEKKQMTIDGDKRITHKIGWPIWLPELRIEYLSIAGEKFGMSSSTPMNVYIQNHALTRLKERMDDMPIGFLQYSAFESIKDPIISRNKKGELLIEFRMFGVKTGYFLAEIVKEDVLLRTFLFLTNNGTPEGEKLHKNTGIMKEDKKYLNIDKISSFLNSDIVTNDRVKQIFIDAGCESLFNVDKSMYLGEVTKQKKLADLVSHHLKLDGDH